MYKLYNPHGCTVTIFAPYDCGNNCDFCVNKKDYKKYKSDFEAVLESIKKIHQITKSLLVVISLLLAASLLLILLSYAQCWNISNL